MSDRRRNRTALAVLVLLSLLLLTVDYRQGDEGPISALQRGALAVFGPVQQGFAEIVRPIGGFFSSVGELGRLRERNAALEEEIRDLQDGRLAVAALEKENEELRSQLAMRERLGVTTTTARVVAQAPGVWGWEVVIDVGADHGVHRGMAVISADGLVGRVERVTRRNAWVQLLTDPNSRIVVRVVEVGEEAHLTGRGSRPFQLSLLNPEAEVPAGAEVVTRTFQGSTIPDGIPIGVVDAPGPAGSGRYLAVRPFVDFTKLTFVQVILDAPIPPLEAAEDEIIPGPEPPRPSPQPLPTPDNGQDDDE